MSTSDWNAGGLLELGPPNERQGAYRHTDLYVWYCGDDVCNCSQVVCERRYDNPLCFGATWTVRIWQGPFYTDGEGTEERHAPELLRAFREVRVRYPDEKWGTVTMPAHPERYPDYMTPEPTP